MPAVHISYSQTSGGRSGHALKDLFTSVIISRLLDYQAVLDPSWAQQRILPLENLKPILQRALPGYAASYSYQAPKRYWDGISFEAFERFEEWVRGRISATGPIHVRLSGVFRIHLFQVSNWEHRGLIEPGLFAEINAVLRRMYWGAITPPEPIWPPRSIAIHARRGDVASPSNAFYRTMGPGGVWNAEFYQRCIDQLADEFPNSSISLYSEQSGGDDLATLSGATLELGGDQQLEEHFRRMVSADLFVPACSSLSKWAAYISAARVRAYHLKRIRHFGAMVLPERFEEGQLPK